jgi:hypothetical protein
MSNSLVGARSLNSVWFEMPLPRQNATSVRGRLAVDFLPVRVKIGTDLFRYPENCLVDRAFPIFLVKPKPVSGHETLASTKELPSPANVLSRVSMRSTRTLARLPPLFIRQNYLGRSLEVDRLCRVLSRKMDQKVAERDLC